VETSAQPEAQDTAAVESTPEPVGDSEPETQTQEAEEQEQPFSVESWDGNIDNIPEDYREIVRKIQQNFESGYTKKFQALADDKKAFEASKSSFEETKTSDSEELVEAKRERDMYRSLLEGAEDPRVGEFASKLEATESERDSWKSKFENYAKQVEAFIEQDNERYIQRFKSQHQELWTDPAKRTEFSGLLEADWDMEEAVKLIGLPKDVIELAQEHRDSGSTQNQAIKLAKLEKGVTTTKPRVPRPAAQVTSGSSSQNNHESVTRVTPGGDSPHDDRLAAAKEARLAFQKGHRR
jgi:hypothetical protein